jgi:hypothetical protein
MKDWMFLLALAAVIVAVVVFAAMHGHWIAG